MKKTKYMTKRGRIFFSTPPFYFVVENGEYIIRGNAFSLVTFNRDLFETRLEMDDFQEYVTELYVNRWN